MELVFDESGPRFERCRPSTNTQETANSPPEIPASSSVATGCFDIKQLFIILMLLVTALLLIFLTLWLITV